MYYWYENKKIERKDKESLPKEWKKQKEWQEIH